MDNTHTTVLTVSLEQSAYTIPEGGSATLYVAFDGNLSQEYTVPIEVGVVENTANGKFL